MEALMRFLSGFILAVSTWPVLACHPPYVEYEPVYQAREITLSASEIRRMADWRGMARRSFPNDGTYSISVQKNPRVGISARLAKIRAQDLKRLLLNLGVKESDILDAEIKNYGYDAPANAEARRLANAAYISVDPRCPHPCCPGPQPSK
ncbi:MULTISPECIES: hypothetical protein [Cupriavidus]